MIRKNLLDTNALIALTNDEHQHYPMAQRWFSSPANEDWGICPLTEAGFIRIVMNPASGPLLRTFDEAVQVLDDLAQRPGFRYWPLMESWASLTAPFADRIFGHQQVTDAYLLGLAIKHDGVLVTFNRALRYMAGPRFAQHLHLLE